MTLFIVLAVPPPWSLWRQMHAHAVTREGLIKLPLIFAAIGAFSLTRQDAPVRRGGRRVHRHEPGPVRRAGHLARRGHPHLDRRPTGRG